ncbi:MAG TPA: UDP-2,3-diacylglucosamine diphosphatase [Candidatus Eisenbacteria bacterium]|nr:UDP-2,3-diacylglucosamine diphosphatase [Candidatus Eisenbacteria bacterium]
MAEPETVYFFSDAHLGTDPREQEAVREARLHDFLTSLVGRASALYIVGDLFDFWFEYRTAIPRRHFATLAVLRRLRDSGVKITYLNGNHDFWLGPFLRDEMGMDTHQDALTLDLQGHRIWLHHGDGLGGGDLGYKALKKVLRNPTSIALYRLLHPDLGIPFAHVVSRWSRHSRGERPLDGERLWRNVAQPRFAEGFDTVMIGHLHHAWERRENGRAFFLLGDWIEAFTYVRLEGGVFSLETWPARSGR